MKIRRLSPTTRTTLKPLIGWGTTGTQLAAKLTRRWMLTNLAYRGLIRAPYLDSQFVHSRSQLRFIVKYQLSRCRHAGIRAGLVPPCGSEQQDPLQRQRVSVFLQN